MKEEFKTKGYLWLMPFNGVSWMDLYLDEQTAVTSLIEANKWKIDKEYETYLHARVSLDIIPGDISKLFLIRDLGKDIATNLYGLIIGANRGYIDIPVSKLVDLDDNKDITIKIPIKVSENNKKNWIELEHWSSNIIATLHIDQSKETTQKYQSFKEALAHLS